MRDLVTHIFEYMVPDHLFGDDGLCEEAQNKIYNISMKAIGDRIKKECYFFTFFTAEVSSEKFQVPNFKKIDCFVLDFKYSFIHIPKTGGKFLWYNFNVYRDHHDHITFNKNHDSCNLHNVDFDSNGAVQQWHFASNDNFITVVRNPYDWLVSIFYHFKLELIKTNKKFKKSVTDVENFDIFIKDICLNNFEYSNKLFPFNDGLTGQLFDEFGNICVRNILFFERIEKGCEFFKIGKRKNEFLNKVVSLNQFADHENFKNFKKNKKKDYKFFYTEELIELVKDKFSFDLEFLGYDFDGLIHDKDVLVVDNFKKEI